MNLSFRLHIAICATISFLWFAVGCTYMAAPAPATKVPATERASETPVNTPVLVGFATAPPTNSPEPASTPPVSATIAGESVASTAPVVQLVSPLTNTQVSVNQSIYVVAYAASESGVARVEISDDNVLVKAENASVPLRTLSAVVQWTPTQIGAHVLRAVAYDANNQSSAPEEVTVNVIPDARRPAAVIVYPLGTPQVELGSVLQVQAVATDEVGVSQLDLWADNQLYTYVRSQSSNGQSPFPVVFAWTAMSPGNHALFVRAHDSQGQTTDSGPLKVFVADTHAPDLSVAFDRTNALMNEPITVTVSALDVSGIQRVELWTGKEISNTITSVSPARQTYLTTQVTWQSGIPGDYAIVLRAYNTGGTYRESRPQTISILRPGQPTPTLAPTPTPTRTRPPRPAPTPRLQPPPAPSAEISQPSDRFSNQWPIHLVFGGQGNAELDRVEVWGYYQDQLNPQVICSLDARTTTQKSGQCDWSPTTAGAVYLYAQAIDIYGQVGRSALISGSVGVPGLPTPTPTPVSVAGRWSASVQAGQYSATLRQVGSAIRGDFKITSSETPPVETSGRITSGSIKGDRVTFHVDFAPLMPMATPTPSLPPDTLTPTSEAVEATVTEAATEAVPASPPVIAPAMDFDCTVDSSATMLDCRFKDARGANGTAQFQRQAAP